MVIWDELERLPWKKKFNILHKAANLDPDWGKGPLQFASEVFKIRDRLAHGKPERVLGPSFDDPLKAAMHIASPPLEPEWYSTLNRIWALSAADRFRELMNYLANMHGLDDSDYLMLSQGGTLFDDGE